MTEQEINQYVTENILGQCWHKWHIENRIWVCTKCEMIGMVNNPDYFSRGNWLWFGYLWEFCQKQEWWEDFLDVVYHATCGRVDDWIDPPIFATKLMEWDIEMRKT